MRNKDKDKLFDNLPACAAEFIKLVIKKMRYRKKVRADVQAELIAHFEDALKDCASEEEKEQKAEKLIADFGDAKLLGVLARRAKKRCRPLWRTVVARTFQTIGVLFICLVLYCVYISLGIPTITVNYVDQINRLAQPVADESLNAAPLYQKAIDLCKEPPKIEGIELLKAIGDKDWVGRLAEDEISALRRWISSNIEALDYFIQASEKPHCWWERQAEGDVVRKLLMPELVPMKKLAKLTCWRAKLKAHGGDLEGSFDDLLACCRAGRHLKGPGPLVEQLVGIAIQQLGVEGIFTVLDTQNLDAPRLKSLQERFEQLMAEDTYVMNFKTESFFVLDFIQRCYTDNGRGSGHMIPGRLEEFWLAIFNEQRLDEVLEYGRFLAMALVGADRREMTRMFETAYDSFQEWANKTPWQLRQEDVDFEIGIGEWSSLKRVRYWPITMFLPALGRVVELSHRSRANGEALITTIALLRYKKDKGIYPGNLDELKAAGFIEKVPMDLYSDQPLVYKRVNGDFTLYSLGADFDDDGAVQTPKDRWGRKDEGGDAVFWPVQ